MRTDSVLCRECLAGTILNIGVINHLHLPANSFRREAGVGAPMDAVAT